MAVKVEVELDSKYGKRSGGSMGTRVWGLEYGKMMGRRGYDG